MTSKDNHKDESDRKSPSELIQVSHAALLATMIPMGFLAYICWTMGLSELSLSLMVGCFRTFGQLSVLGTLLQPIFAWGNRWLVLGYVLFMMFLASYEAASRTKYTFDGQFLCILGSLVGNVGLVGILAFGFLIRPTPKWNPRYVIPITGMLLGNSMNGISLSLDALTRGMVEEKHEIELYLSFGATKWEAMSRLLAKSIQTGTTPILNTMRVIGIISIPGQILGGSPAMTAARYQMLIIFLIAMATMSVILTNCFLAVEVAFDSHDMLRTTRFTPSHRKRVAGLIVAWFAFVGSYLSGGVDPSANVPPEIATSDVLPTTPKGELSIRVLRESCTSQLVDSEQGLQVVGLSRSIPAPSKEGAQEPRVLFSNVSMSVDHGDLLLVGGPSGVGKSTFLRMVAGLSPLVEDPTEMLDIGEVSSPPGEVQLAGKSWTTEFVGGHASAHWRKQVRYVTQSKVNIPGTPRNFVSQVTNFGSWNNQGLSFDELSRGALKYMTEWGLGADSYDKEWSVLSGGEAQRVIVAIALASQPRFLLFDESTSALDTTSKMAVEHSVKEYLHEHRGGACWISHDPQQAERMSSLEEGVCPAT
eukprot:Nitzschia sp. Nitz4//scaffold62_size106224//99099//100874//NITZ4_004373-RA/size106224-processed-gene-0.177-mRNA-1//-1//CDS//3329555907//745//frame0